MRLTFSKNPLNRFSCWLENEVFTPVSRYYYTHKKAHYKCCVCKYMISPYFEDKRKWSLTYDMGWHKFKGWKCYRWICHTCADHGFSPSSEWDKWQDIVEENNDKLLDIIKNKDIEYYNYWWGDEDE